MVVKAVREELAQDNSPVVSLWMTGEAQSNRMFNNDQAKSLSQCSTLASVCQRVIDWYSHAGTPRNHGGAGVVTTDTDVQNVDTNPNIGTPGSLKDAAANSATTHSGGGPGGGNGKGEQRGDVGKYIQKATPEKLQPGCPVVVGNDRNLVMGTVARVAEDGRFQVDLITGETVKLQIHQLRCVNVTVEQAKEAFKQAVCS